MAVQKTIVAAFELGRKQIGYAYTSRSCISEFIQNKLSENEPHGSYTEPAVVLLDKTGKCNSFGHEAIEKYRTLQAENMHGGWILFHNFTTFLQCDKKLSPKTATITDVHGKRHAAFQITSMLIEHLNGSILKKIDTTKVNCIQYVITFPGVHNDSANDFIAEAAEKAGLERTNLSIFPEKYVASLWLLKFNRNLRISIEDRGNKFMIIDAEGIDIEVAATELSNLRPTTSQTFSYGGACVDIEFMGFIGNEIGNTVVEYSKNQPLEYNELLLKCRSQKAKFNGNRALTFQPPFDLIDAFNKSTRINRIADKIRIDASYVARFFELSIQSFMSVVDLYWKKGITVLLVLDEFVRCPFVQDSVSNEIPDIQFLDGNASNLTVLFGALLTQQPIDNSIGDDENPGSVVKVVAAFDIGTTYSGYAFSFVREPYKVQTTTWYSKSPSAKLNSLKAPTCILLDANEEFHSFGFEAEEHFADLESTTGWRLFRHFKMILHQQTTLSKQTEIEDLGGNSFPAMPIFTMVIRHLHQKLLEVVHLQYPEMPEAFIQYVVTVPAIWDDKAKQFMREAAVKAGISSKRLKLVLEPEVAPLWYLATDREHCMEAIPIGSKYMVVDLGGGTADISVQERLPNNQIRVIQKASGGPWGGTCVDTNFVTFLKTTFGFEEFEHFKQTELLDYFDLLDCFETKKRSQLDGNLSLRIPSSLLRKSTPKLVRSDKIKLDQSTVLSWFEEPVQMLVDHIRSQMTNSKLDDKPIVMLVGGYAESRYVQQQIKEGISGVRLIVPEDASTAVLKGAVIFGHNPKLVASRIMSFTYGIRLRVTDHSRRPSESMGIGSVNQKRFKVFVRVNEEVPFNHQVTRTTTPRKATTSIKVYRTLAPKPKFTTDTGCELLGELKIRNRDDMPLKDQTHLVTFMFGDTELLVTVKDPTTGKEVETKLSCLR